MTLTKAVLFDRDEERSRWNRFWGAALASALALGLVGASAVRADEHVITSHGISAFGDLKYSADFTHWDYVNPNAPKGGTFSARGTGASGTFDSLNAFILKGEPAQGLGLLYDSLLIGSADEADSAYGLVAETLEYPEDRSWVIFNMRPEATFADGAPITADDVVFSFNILVEKGHPAYRIRYADFDTVEALGPHRVKFTFKDGVPTRDLPATAGGISILPRHYYDNVDFAESTMTPPVGSGAYVVADAQPGRSITYCRNPDYWGQALAVNVGTYNFECIIYEYFADRTAAFEALKSGEYLFHEEYYSKIWATEYNFPSLERGWVIREEITDGRPSGTQGYWINLRREKFADPRVREALGKLFNFEWSNETLFYGIYQRTDSFWENSPMQAEGVPDGEELAVLEPFRDQLPETVFSQEPFTPPVYRPTRLDRKALREAKALMADAGYSLIDGLYHDAEGKRLTIELIDDSPAFERINTPFVDNLRKAGFDAKYIQVDSAQMEQRQEDFDYDITPGRLVMSLSPGLELRQLLGSAGAAEKGTLNLSGLADPVVDALIEKIIEAPDRPTVEARVRALDRVLRSKHIWIPQWYGGTHKLAYWDIFGRPEIKPPYSRAVMATWWIDQAKLDKLKAEGAL